jgi:hypothetical protein
MKRVGLGLTYVFVADVAWAGNGLGTSLGLTLGTALGEVLGTALPVLGSLGVVAVALLVGIRIVRRKR